MVLKQVTDAGEELVSYKIQAGTMPDGKGKTKDTLTLTEVMAKHSLSDTSYIFTAGPTPNSVLLLEQKNGKQTEISRITSPEVATALTRIINQTKATYHSQPVTLPSTVEWVVQTVTTINEMMDASKATKKPPSKEMLAQLKKDSGAAVRSFTPEYNIAIGWMSNTGDDNKTVEQYTLERTLKEPFYKVGNTPYIYSVGLNQKMVRIDRDGNWGVTPVAKASSSKVAKALTDVVNTLEEKFGFQKPITNAEVRAAANQLADKISSGAADKIFSPEEENAIVLLAKKVTDACVRKK